MSIPLVLQVGKEFIYEYLGAPYHPPTIANDADEEAFQSEWWDVQSALRCELEKLGFENGMGDGDYLVSESRTTSRGIGVSITSDALFRPELVPAVLRILASAPVPYSICFSTENDPLVHFFVERDRIIVSDEKWPDMTVRLGIT